MPRPTPRPQTRRLFVNPSRRLWSAKNVNPSRSFVGSVLEKNLQLELTCGGLSLVIHGGLEFLVHCARLRRLTKAMTWVLEHLDGLWNAIRPNMNGNERAHLLEVGDVIVD